jgi:hypothetical protein
MGGIFVPVGGQKMVEKNVGDYPCEPSITGFQQFNAGLDIHMAVGKSINVSVKLNAKGHLFRIVQVLPSFHIVSDEIAQLDFMGFAR